MARCRGAKSWPPSLLLGPLPLALRCPRERDARPGLAALRGISAGVTLPSVGVRCRESPSKESLAASHLRLQSRR